MKFLDMIYQKARQNKARIVLPEGLDSRVISAAPKILEEGLASSVYLLGNEDEVRGKAEELKLDLGGVEIVNPGANEWLDDFAREYYQLRKHKGMSEQEAYEKIQIPLNFGAMMVRKDKAQSTVAGAENPTGKVLLAAFTIIKTAPGTKFASSFFVMDLPDSKWGKDGLLIYADCGTIPDPTSEQLAEITIAACDNCQKLLDTEPKAAMLSFSTKGSAQHENVDKVIEAFNMVKEKRPDLKVDGELQADAALIPGVAEKKAPGSPLAGKANVLIFPDLQAGNIAYKLTQRLANAEAYGPILQGFAKPCSDLSRGCSVDDVVRISAITLAQL